MVMRDESNTFAAEARRSFYRLAGRYAEAVTISTPLGLLAIPTNDEVVGERTFVQGRFEAETTERAVRLLREQGALPERLDGRDVLEVGANIGTQTLQFVHTLGADRVIALEPAPAAVRMLRATVAANALEDRVIVLPLAASADDGVVRMEANPANVGDWRVRARDDGDADMGEDAWDLLDVPARRLDALLEDGQVELDRLALVWMDCQGHEGHILAGAESILASDVPVVSEFWPYGLRRAGGLERFAELVAASGRRVFDLRGSLDGVPAPVDGATALLELADFYGPPRYAAVDSAFTDLVLVR